MEFPSLPPLSPSVQGFRQLISESSSSSTFNTNSVSCTTTKTRTRMMSSSSSSSACLICTHSHPTNTALSFDKKRKDPHPRALFLGSLFLEGSRRDNEGKEDFVFCTVCLPTVTRLLSLQEEVDDIKARIQAVLKLQRQSFPLGEETRKEDDEGESTEDNNNKEVDFECHQNLHSVSQVGRREGNHESCALEKDDMDSSLIVCKQEEEVEMYQEELDSFMGKVQVLYDDENTTTTTSPCVSGHEEGDDDDDDLMSQSNDEETPWCISPEPDPSSDDDLSPVEKVTPEEKEKKERQTSHTRKLRDRVTVILPKKGKPTKTLKKKKKKSKRATMLGPRLNCLYCDKDYNRREHLLRHMRSVHVDSVAPSEHQVCPTCSQTFFSQEVYDAHSHPVPNDPSQVIYTCSLCTNKTFNNKTQFMLHKVKRHSGPSICYFCSKVFKDSARFQLHLGSHTLEKPYFCDKDAAPYPRHIFDNTRAKGQGDYQCPICGKKFTTVKSVRKHVKWVHQEKTKVVLTTTPSECPECGKTFTKDQLKRHMKTVHLMDATLPPSLFTCHICNAGFLKREVFEAHTHPDPSDPTEVTYVCNICQRFYESRSGYVKHVSKSHRHPIAFQCQFCGKDMKTRAGLRKHRRFCSSEGVGCINCDQVFPTRAEMIDHERVIHKGLSSTKCAVCFKCFLTAHHLQRHVKTHKRRNAKALKKN